MGRGPCALALGTSQVRAYKELTDEGASLLLLFESTQTADEVILFCERAPRGLRASAGVQPHREDAPPQADLLAEEVRACQVISGKFGLPSSIS